MDLKTWFKEEGKSFLITFFVAVAFVLVEQIDSLTIETFKTGAWIGILFGAGRAGVKALLTLFVSLYSKK